MTICRLIHLRIRNILNKSCRENQNTHFTSNNVFPKIVQYNNMAHARCLLDKQGYTLAHTRTPARPHTHTHKQKYVILIAFSLQQWLRERAAMLRYTYIACLV